MRTILLAAWVISGPLVSGCGEIRGGKVPPQNSAGESDGAGDDEDPVDASPTPGDDKPQGAPGDTVQGFDRGGAVRSCVIADLNKMECYVDPEGVAFSVACRDGGHTTYHCGCGDFLCSSLDATIQKLPPGFASCAAMLEYLNSHVFVYGDRTWRRLSGDRTYAEATDACAGMGGSWRIAYADELAQAEEMFRAAQLVEEGLSTAELACPGTYWTSRSSADSTPVGVAVLSVLDSVPAPTQALATICAVGE